MPFLTYTYFVSAPWIRLQQADKTLPNQVLTFYTCYGGVKPARWQTIITFLFVRCTDEFVPPLAANTLVTDGPWITIRFFCAVFWRWQRKTASSWTNASVAIRAFLAFEPNFVIAIIAFRTTMFCLFFITGTVIIFVATWKRWAVVKETFVAGIERRASSWCARRRGGGSLIWKTLQMSANMKLVKIR